MDRAVINVIKIINYYILHSLRPVSILVRHSTVVLRVCQSLSTTTNLYDNGNGKPWLLDIGKHQQLVRSYCCPGLLLSLRGDIWIHKSCDGGEHFCHVLRDLAVSMCVCAYGDVTLVPFSVGFMFLLRYSVVGPPSAAELRRSVWCEVRTREVYCWYYCSRQG